MVFPTGKLARSDCGEVPALRGSSICTQNVPKFISTTIEPCVQSMALTTRAGESGLSVKIAEYIAII